jgi:hypothetical protein
MHQISAVMKLKKSVYILLFTIIAILIVTNGGLLKKTIEYKDQNRKLILQNDSLQSVVISLNRGATDTLAYKPAGKKANKKKARNS